MGKRNVEILAPAGSLEALYASLRMGADAVYVGAERFGARAYADNPRVDELREALTYAHLRDKKIYLTTNTLLRDEELTELYDMIVPLYEAGLDACIVQDAGVLSFLHENFPDLPLHASTQMTLFSGEEAELYRSLGVTRYVPARELTIEEIREARKQTDMEIEVFVHGALCYCYSGQCLMSEVIGGRSGNRGMCAQPCRLPFTSRYGKGHLLSTKDICTLPFIPELVDAGIDSFKIEGRMKRKEYSAFLSRLYRRYVDLYLKEGREVFRELVEDEESVLWRDYKKCLDLYNRGGFSDSYLFERDKKQMVDTKRNGHAGLLVGTVCEASKGSVCFELYEDIHYQDVLEFRNKDGSKEYEYTVKDPADRGEKVHARYTRGCHMTVGQEVYRTKNTALLEEINQQIEEVGDRLPLCGTWTAELGEPITFEVEGRGVKTLVKGMPLQAAEKRAVTEEDVRQRLDAMGNTNYVWETLDIRQAAGGFVPLGEMKRLRREGITAWEKLAQKRREKPEFRGLTVNDLHSGRKPVTMIGVSNPEQLRVALETNAEKVLIHLRLADWHSSHWDILPQLLQGRSAAISMPRVLRGEGGQKWLQLWKEKGNCLKRINVSMVLINSHRSLLLARDYFPRAEFVAEENLYQENQRAVETYAALGVGPIVPQTYGRVAVMVTEGCVKVAGGHCDGRQERIRITSPKKDSFVVVNHCQICYNTIYTNEPVKRQRKNEDLRLEFTWESEDEMRKVIGEWNLL